MLTRRLNQSACCIQAAARASCSFVHDTVEDVLVMVMTMGSITRQNQAIQNEDCEGQAILEELALHHCLCAPR
jgi:hypothetical protein